MRRPTAGVLGAHRLASHRFGAESSVRTDLPHAAILPPVPTESGSSEPIEAPDERTFDYARTVALSDGVFAIALTLLVLNIGVPELARGHDDSLARRLLDHDVEVFSYALSFTVIALLWVRHHGFFRCLGRIDAHLTVLNLIYLGLVAFLPYPTRILGLHGDQPVAFALYAATVALVSLIGGLTRVHAVRAGLLTEAGRRHVARREHWLVAPAVFLASIPIAFASTRVALVSWLALTLLPLLRDRLARG